jgi:diguanylate cyclase (GGDEF)-like protein
MHLRYSRTMTTLYSRAQAWLATASADGRLVADEVVMSNVRGMRWLVLAIVPLNLIHFAIFRWGIGGGSPELIQWKSAAGSTHLAMAAWLLLLGAAAHYLGRSSRPGLAANALQLLAPLSAILFTASIATIDQWVTPNISPFLLGCVFVCLLFQIRPTAAVALFALGYAFFFVAIASTQPDPQQLLTNRLNGLTAVVLGLLLSVVLWHKNTRYILLQRELSQRNAELTQQQDELVWLAKRDALTGLFNRGEFLRLAEQELLRSQRHGTDTSAIMLDLDFFKRVNDVYGHPAGDAVLKHTADCLLGTVRATDVVARIGGEEFVVLLPQTALDAAVTLAEKLLRVLRQTPAPIQSDLKINVTASLGVGCLPGGHTGSVASLYAAADHALYKAKQGGRNRVEKTPPDGSLTPSDFQRMRRQ